MVFTQVGGASRGVSRASSQAGYGGMQPQYQEEDVIHEEEQIQVYCLNTPTAPKDCAKQTCALQ